MQDPSHYENLARFHIDRSDFCSAACALEQLIRISPFHDWAYSDLGTVSALMGNQESARMLFQRAFLLNPLNAVCLKNLGMLAAGNERHLASQRFYE